MIVDFSCALRLATAIGIAAGAFAAPCGAQPQTSSPMRMTTQTPPGIAMPDTLETRLGTLRFFDGFPDDASVEALYDNLDFQRAVQAYLLGLAPVSQIANREGMLELGPANTTVPIFETMMNARSIFLTPNNNTPYTWFWLDLREGPLVLEVPPRVLGLIDDMWYTFVTDVGMVGPDAGQGGKYLLLPPGHDGPTPDGYFVVPCETYSVWVAWRTFLENGDPAPGVERVKRFTRIYRLSEAANPPTINFVNVSGRDFATVGRADEAFWELLNRVVQEEPTDSVDPVALGFWASIGIRKGQPFEPDDRMRRILREAAEVGDATARAMTYRMRLPEAYFYPHSAWRSGFLGGYRFTDPSGALILDSYASFFFYATGVTPAMDSRTVGQGSQYMAAFVDAEGNPLDGGRHYRLHLPPNIPVANFWSVILYDNQTRSMLQSDQDWPAVSSQTRGLHVNPDSSVDVYFGPTPPAGRENNWVQTIPGKGWNTLLRLYGPLQPWFDKTWRPSEIELIEP